jgi:hypothetical protein
MKTSRKKMLEKLQQSKECPICGECLLGTDPDDMTAHMDACWHAEKACVILEDITDPGKTDYNRQNMDDLLRQVMRLERHLISVHVNIRNNQTVTITR